MFAVINKKYVCEANGEQENQFNRFFSICRLINHFQDQVHSCSTQIISLGIIR